MSPTSPSPGDSTGPIVALCGGVGAARFLSGLVRVAPPEEIVAVVNTGDDREFYGVLVSPDLDIVTYTLAGVVDREQGYGLAGDGYALMDRLEELGHEVWFRLGDRDFAHCLHRTLRLREGAGLAAVAAELATSHGVVPRLLPMSEDPCPTLVELDDGTKLHFEEYMIRERAPDRVAGVDLSAAAAAKPAPGVIEAIASARAIVFCPSNPVVSIGPILAVPGIREALVASEAPVVAISPIVGGAPIKGPASQLLRGIGVEVSATGVANHYRELCSAYVLDDQDADQLDAVRALGLSAAATDSIMVDAEAAARLARVALELVGLSA
jgi:LPPG:FO 2-phospho-L-lactate transferase